MRTGKIKKLFRDQAKPYLPSENLKTRIDGELFGGAVKAKGKRTKRFSKKIYAFAGSLAAAAIAAVVALTVLFTLPVSPPPSRPGDGNSRHSATTEERAETYAFSAVSSSVVLLKYKIGLSASTPSAAALFNAAGSSDSDERLAAINEYMPLMESLLADGDKDEYTAESSDMDGYSEKLTARVGSLSGVKRDKTVEIILYYNEIEIPENESERKLEGFMKIGRDISYTVEGEISGKDGGEKITFIAAPNVDDENNYVKIKTEIKTDKKEFEYEIHENGSEHSFKIAKETEDGETELELKIENGEETELEIAFKTESEGDVEIIKVAYCSGGGEIVYSVSVSKDGAGKKIYVYTATDSESKELDADDPFDKYDDEKSDGEESDDEEIENGDSEDEDEDGSNDSDDSDDVDND